MIELFTNEVSMTQNLGFYLGEMLEPGDIILLSGEMGAGKTQFTKGIARGLMSEQEPRSPTFVLLAKYKGRMDIYHADLYRLDNGYPEVFDIGLDEVMHSKLKFLGCLKVYLYVFCIWNISMRVRTSTHILMLLRIGPKIV